MKCKPLLIMDTVKKELAHINKHSSMTQVIPIYIDGELLVKPYFIISSNKYDKTVPFC